MPEIDRAVIYYRFIKWMKVHYPAYYLSYGMYITVPASDMVIKINLDYVQPEDKKQITAIVTEFNASLRG